jgi:crossover junction endodeoxyribonuclease RusA
MGRAHGYKKAAAKSRHKTEARYAARASGIWPGDQWPDEIPIRLIVHTKTVTRPDRDNLVASMKAALDGIALAMGVDDKRFLSPAVEFAEPRSRPCVYVEVGE